MSNHAENLGNIGTHIIDHGLQGFDRKRSAAEELFAARDYIKAIEADNAALLAYAENPSSFDDDNILIAPHPGASLLAELEATKAKLESVNFWKGVYPKGMTAADIKNELHDFNCIMESAGEVYCYVTGNRVSKPMTTANAVIGAADEYSDELTKQAIAEERKVWDAEHKEATAELEALRGVVAKLPMTKDGAPVLPGSRLFATSTHLTSGKNNVTPLKVNHMTGNQVWFLTSDNEIDTAMLCFCYTTNRAAHDALSARRDGGGE